MSGIEPSYDHAGIRLRQPAWFRDLHRLVRRVWTGTHSCRFQYCLHHDACGRARHAGDKRGATTTEPRTRRDGAGVPFTIGPEHPIVTPAEVIAALAGAGFDTGFTIDAGTGRVTAQDDAGEAYEATGLISLVLPDWTRYVRLPLAETDGESVWRLLPSA